MKFYSILLTRMVFLSLFLCSCSINTSPGKGQKIGQIVKVSKVGIIFPTWECELIKGGFSDGSGSLGNTFHFTIEKSDLAFQAMRYMENQQEVVVSYETYFICSVTSNETLDNTFAISINKASSNKKD